MKEFRRLGVHIVLLIVAALVAFQKAKPDKGEITKIKPGEVELWGGKPADVSAIRYASKRMTVSLTAKKDAAGSWYLGKVEPGADADKEKPDAGAMPHGHPSVHRGVEKATFVSVSVTERIAKELAPLRAKALVGKVEGDRNKAFGLDEPKGTLTLTVSGKTHVLTMGGAAPGGSDRYVRYGGDGMVYVVAASVVRDFESGASRLSERSLHSFKPTEVDKVEIAAGGKSRALIRGGTAGRRFWADASKPQDNDETAANWLQKLNRLRPVKYLEKLPEGATKVMRVELVSKKGEKGYVELYHKPAPPQPGDEPEEEAPAPSASAAASAAPSAAPAGSAAPAASGSAAASAAASAKPAPKPKKKPRKPKAKDEYFVTSEQLRLFATVASSLGEQVRQDLGSVVH